MFGTRDDYIREWNCWQSYHNKGGQDPFYADGTNLNLTRNHMIHDINLGVIPPDDMLLPPEVPWQYMAQPEEIIERAKTALSLYKATPEFAELKSAQRSIKDKELLRLAQMIPARITQLEDAIEKNDLVYCRMAGRDPTYYINLAKETAAKCGLINHTGEQVSLFELMGCR